MGQILMSETERQQNRRGRLRPAEPLGVRRKDAEFSLRRRAELLDARQANTRPEIPTTTCRG